MSTNPVNILSPKFRQQRKFLLILPLIAVPGLFGIFYSLGGGQGPKKSSASGNSTLGFNTELPKAKFDRNDGIRNKLEYYQKADEDSLRRKEYLQRDPYRKDTLLSSAPPQPAREDAHQSSDQLLRQLDQLKHSLTQSPAPTSPTPPFSPGRWQQQIQSRPTDTPAGDPQLEKLNIMLDKVLRIQHPAENRPGTSTPGNTEELIAIDSSNTLPATR